MSGNKAESRLSDIENNAFVRLGTLVAEFKASSYTHAIAAATTRYGWVRTTRGTAQQKLYSDWEPAGATSGVSGTST